MPTMPLDVTRRAKRFSEQRWLLDAIINLMGPEWDQGRLGYMAAACGHDSQGDFIALRHLVKTYNDMMREFMKAARRRELRAEAELKQGHEVTARESFFTANILYGGAQWSIEANTPLNLELNQKKTDCYAKFIQLAGRHIEQLDVPFEDRSVPAILSLPPTYKQGEQVPCVVIVSGMDGWKELSVAMDGDKWLQRGFAVLAVDGPGQGESLIREVWYNPDTYGKLGPSAFDVAATRPEIDPKRIVVHGLSFGSYWASTLAAAEPRFLACGVAMTNFESSGFSIFQTASPTFKLRFMYMTGAKDEAELDQLTQKLDVSKLAPHIKCPFLVAAGEDDQLTDSCYTFGFLNSLTGPKSLIFYEGEDHGMHASRAGQLGPEAYTMVADWLSDRVRGIEAKSTYTEVDATGLVHVEPWGDKREYTYGITESTKKMIFGN
ncbi:MAG: acetylxylan esterase [Chroococcidiopsidaceae cyanobacterium CP_BM_RX_35]|nr:acetylxylan esterase [Chroococcidiopsidaceae cyanobacterium CP_BM_RX_35]